MNNRLALLLTAGLGAGAMYYLDPARGRYRRGLLRDQVVHAGHETRRAIGVVGRDARNRAFGTTASALSLFRSEQPDTRVLVERVRACLGRAVTHPSSIHVEASDGVVTLSGPILEDEVRPLLGCVLGVHGVKDVRNQLEVHSEPGRIPGLQGTPRQPVAEGSAWSPAARAVAGLAGGTAALYGFNRRNAPGLLLGTAGAVLLGRALTNLGMRPLFGVGAHAVDIQKSIRINAPVDQVFRLWDDVQNFPSFMTHVRRVRRIENARGDADRWRWTVRAPSGIEFEFDAVVIAREENRLLAWETEGSALVRHMGRVLFTANSDGSTTVDVKMVYNPIAGAVGHAVARLLGADPKHQMDDDLMRMKSFLETGKAPHDAAGRIAEMSAGSQATEPST